MRNLFVILSVMLVSLLFATHAFSGKNFPNKNCYSSDGDQYYLRAYSGDKNAGEVGICDEPVGNYTIRGTCLSYGFYLSNYAVKWANTNASQYSIWVISKDKNRQVSKICQFR